MINRRLWNLVAVTLLLVGAGCGGKQPVSVRGALTLDGQPVEGATVLFLPEAGGEGARQATGQTVAGGKFELTTFRSGDGAFPGDYKVVVQYAQGVQGPPAQNMKEAFQGMQKAQKEAGNKAPRYVIPPRYSDPAKTDLRQKVPASGEVHLDLKSK
jgi:hypothetical protein